MPQKKIHVHVPGHKRAKPDGKNKVVKVKDYTYTKHVPKKKK
jgi:hypothetical protein